MGLSVLQPVTPQSNGDAPRQTIKASMDGVLPLFSDFLFVDVIVIIILILSFFYC
jgi:hypothetical protein